MLPIHQVLYLPGGGAEAGGFVVGRHPFSHSPHGGGVDSKWSRIAVDQVQG